MKHKRSVRVAGIRRVFLHCATFYPLSRSFHLGHTRIQHRSNPLSLSTRIGQCVIPYSRPCGMKHVDVVMPVDFIGRLVCAYTRAVRLRLQLLRLYIFPHFYCQSTVIRPPLGLRSIELGAAVAPNAPLTISNYCEEISTVRAIFAPFAILLVISTLKKYALPAVIRIVLHNRREMPASPLSFLVELRVAAHCAHAPVNMMHFAEG